MNLKKRFNPNSKYSGKDEEIMSHTRKVYNTVGEAL